MLGIHELWLFVLSGLLLNVTPGPDTAYIIGRSIQLGWRGGAAAAIGISCGCLFHVFGRGDRAVGAADGVVDGICDPETGPAPPISSSPGIQMLRSRAVPSPTSTLPGDAVPLRRVFWQGVLTNALNPKVALFFLAFLPQFVAADSPHKTLAFLLLGGIFIFNGTLWCLGIAAFAARAAGRIRRSRGALAWINRALGGLFIYLGFRVAMLEAR